MNKPTSRRRFLQIVASSSLLSTFAGSLSYAKGGIEEYNLHHWQGVALGGRAEILLPNSEGADKLEQRILAEITRLEKIFSLYVKGSEINRLNRTGYLEDPSPEFYQLLTKAQSISSLTSGAFDVTVQPLWLLHSEMPKLSPHKREILEPKVRELVGFEHLSVTPSKIAFNKPGMAITLNGIAQGYITDKITFLMKENGFDNSLVNLGEIRTIGSHPSGRDWRVNIVSDLVNSSQTSPEYISLQAGKAIATTTPNGTLLRDGNSHLLRPKGGDQLPHYSSLSVISDNATLADGLSTGLSLMPKDEVRSISSKLDGVKVTATSQEGHVIQL